MIQRVASLAGTPPEIGNAVRDLGRPADGVRRNTENAAIKLSFRNLIRPLACHIN